MLLYLLGACSTAPTANQLPPGNAEFRSGYLDGCGVGRYDANNGHDSGTGYGSDTVRYKSRPDYRIGWDQGHAACYLDEQRAPAMINGG